MSVIEVGVRDAIWDEDTGCGWMECTGWFWIDDDAVIYLMEDGEEIYHEAEEYED